MRFAALGVLCAVCLASPPNRLSGLLRQLETDLHALEEERVITVMIPKGQVESAASEVARAIRFDEATSHELHISTEDLDLARKPMASKDAQEWLVEVSDEIMAEEDAPRPRWVVSADKQVATEADWYLSVILTPNVENLEASFQRPSSDVSEDAADVRPANPNPLPVFVPPSGPRDHKPTYVDKLKGKMETMMEQAVMDKWQFLLQPTIGGNAPVQVLVHYPPDRALAQQRILARIQEHMISKFPEVLSANAGSSDPDHVMIRSVVPDILPNGIRFIVWTKRAKELDMTQFRKASKEKIDQKLDEAAADPKGDVHLEVERRGGGSGSPTLTKALQMGMEGFSFVLEPALYVLIALPMALG